MLKNILNVEGVQQLTKNEQKEINGGKPWIPVCGGTGWYSDEASCIANQHNVWEVETGCCYNHGF
jgi:hypothetical protein